MTDPFRDMIERRLPNWARWRWNDLHQAGPDGYVLQCVQIINLVPPNLRAGWGEVDGNTAKVPQEQETLGEVEIDEEDAENLNGLIQQTPMEHRATLHRAFVLHARVPNGAVAAAIRAIKAVCDANRAVIERMR